MHLPHITLAFIRQVHSKSDAVSPGSLNVSVASGLAGLPRLLGG